MPKQKPFKNIHNHLPPIPLTPILSKIAEEYVVDTYGKPSVLKNIDAQQYGTVPISNTTFALINMVHSWLKSTDGNRSTLFDFQKHLTKSITMSCYVNSHHMAFQHL